MKVNEDIMPEYEHKCTDSECNHEWVDTYSIKQDPPKFCPKCNKETAMRLISLGGKGRVELYGQDLVDKVKVDTEKLKKDIYSSEKLYSNFLGPDKYESIQKKLDKNKRGR